MAGNRVTWDIGDAQPQVHYVYRSETPMDTDTLPSPLASVGGDVSVYEDVGDIVKGDTFYYRVDAEDTGGAIASGEETVFNAYGFKRDIHDIFNDGSIIATYNFNDNANDAGGNYNGTETDIAYGDGIVGKALSDSFTEIPITTELDNGYSFSAWIYMVGRDDNISQFFFTSLELYYAGGLSNGNNEFRIGHKGTLYNFNNTLENNKWQHVVVSQPASGDPIVYLNKAPQTKTGESLGYPEDAIPGVSSVTIGDYEWKGKIDQARFFNRTLSQEEVNELYAQGEHALKDDLLRDGSTVSKFMFNRTAYDSKQDLFGQWTGSKTYANTASGVVADFTGDNYIDLDNHDYGTLFDYDNNFTITFSVLTGEFSFGFTNSENNTGFVLEYDSGSVTLMTATESGSTGNYNVNIASVPYGSDDIVTIVKTGNQTFEIYVTGVLVSTVNPTNTGTFDMQKYSIANSGRQASAGQIKYFVIHNRALTGTEVTTLQNNL